MAEGGLGFTRWVPFHVVYGVRGLCRFTNRYRERVVLRIEISVTGCKETMLTALLMSLLLVFARGSHGQECKLEYSSAIGASMFSDCDLARFDDLTSHACGTTCAEDPECGCAVYERGTCWMKLPECCKSEILTPEHDDVIEQSPPLIRYVPGGLTGVAITTRFWDCAKPTCAWPGWVSAARAAAPARSCKKDGVTTAGSLEQSGASPGGTAFACNNQQPYISTYNPKIAYGFVAFSSNVGNTRSCCACLELLFGDPKLATKRFLVQVINTNGGDLVKNEGHGGYVEIAVPGGGIGGVNGCKAQWNAGPEWGELYGGFGPLRSDCLKLPYQLRRGCFWQYDWLLDIRSNVTYKEIECPPYLTNRSRCKRPSA